MKCSVIREVFPVVCFCLEWHTSNWRLWVYRTNLSNTHKCTLYMCSFTLIELQLKGKYNYYKINDCMEFFLISSVLYPPLQARWFPFLKNYPFFFTNIFQGPALPVDSCCLKCPTTNCSDLERIAWFLCSLTKALVFLYQGTVAAYRIKQSFTLWGIKFPSFSFKDAPSLHLLHCMLNSCHFVYLVWFAIWCKTE